MVLPVFSHDSSWEVQPADPPLGHYHQLVLLMSVQIPSGTGSWRLGKCRLLFLQKINTELIKQTGFPQP